jgi:hypothetical protein
MLAFVNALRPTGLAAVYALLSTPRPRRVLVAYIAVGFAWSFAVGILVVVAPTSTSGVGSPRQRLPGGIHFDSIRRALSADGLSTLR